MSKSNITFATAKSYWFLYKKTVYAETERFPTKPTLREKILAEEIFAEFNFAIDLFKIIEFRGINFCDSLILKHFGELFSRSGILR